MSDIWQKIHEFFEHLVPHDDGCVTVKVRKRDTLWQLAVEFTGEGERWPELAAANPDKEFGRNYILTVGEELKIPTSWLR